MILDKIFALLGFDKLAEQIQHFFEAIIERIREEIKEELTRWMKKAVMALIVGITFVMALLFINIAVSLYLNQLLDSGFVGFFIVAGFYLLLGLIMMMALNQNKNGEHHGEKD